MVEALLIGAEKALANVAIRRYDTEQKSIDCAVDF